MNKLKLFAEAWIELLISTGLFLIGAIIAAIPLGTPYIHLAIYAISGAFSVGAAVVLGLSILSVIQAVRLAKVQP